MSQEKKQSWYSIVAINLLNVLVLIIVLNLVLGGIYFVKDKRTAKKKQSQLENLRQESPYHHFTKEGAPIYDGDLNNYIRNTFDFRAFENADEAETLAMLIEANTLTRMGFDY
jgi:hypothetical protein